MTSPNVCAPTKILKAIAHPERLRLLNALRSGEECVCHLTALARQRQAYISQQLMFLKRAGLIADRKDGLRVYYRITDPRVFDVLDAANALADVTTDQTPARALASCPCPHCEENGQGKRRQKNSARRKK